MFATGLLMLACSDDWALDLANVSDIKGLTKGSVLDKLNKSLADQQIKDGQFRVQDGEANMRFRGVPPASDKIHTSLQTARKDITHAGARAAAALRIRLHYMYRQALQPPARRRCGRFGRCVTCTGRADTASVNSTLAPRDEIADVTKNATMSSRTGSILVDHDRMRQASSGLRSAAPGARHVDFQGSIT